MINLQLKLAENRLILAPMAGITDTIFRMTMRELGAGIVISELVSARGLIEDRKRRHKSRPSKTVDLCRYREEERPLGIQIFGEDPIELAQGASIVEELGADFVDLNLGCPVPKVVKKGGGAAMMKDPARLEKTLAVMRDRISIPLTIKIRTGWDDESINALDCVLAAARAGCAWVAIHGRTRSQGYSGKADWDLIRRIKKASPIPIIGNGDIMTPEGALDRLAESGCDGVMVGRGTLRNPWIFKQALALSQGSRHGVETRDFPKLLDRQKLLLEEDGLNRKPSLHLRKFAAWYSHGYPHSAHFRSEIFRVDSLDEIQERYHRYFAAIDHVPVSVKPVESFFKSGHG